MIKINATNLHVGGGIQVASSFLTELVNMGMQAEEFAVNVSSEVHKNLPTNFVVERFGEYKVVDVSGIRSIGVNDKIISKGVDAVFTIFGPFYRLKKSNLNIVGFAQPWIIYPRNECYKQLSRLQRWKTRLKYWIQGYFFKQADILIVELDHVKEGLIRELGIPAERIRVVHNCLSSLYQDESLWQPVALPVVDCDLRLGFLGRNYLHKNTEVFPAIATALEASYGIRAIFYVTFTDSEWQTCSPEFRDVCVNIGPLSVSQCPLFYKALDGVVFPSLLECFSATPLEAMAMEKPLFASDRPFNRDICKGHAHYFDPLLPETAANQIASVFAAGRPDQDMLIAAKNHAIHFSSPWERAEKYLSVLMQSADKSK